MFTQCERKMFMMKGRVSSTLDTSDENLGKDRATGMLMAGYEWYER